MTIYTSEFQDLLFDESKNLIIETFKKGTEDYTPKTYKEDFLALADAVKKSGKIGIEGILVDMRNFLYTISPALQEWHNKEVFPVVVSVGLTKMGVLVSPDIFAQVSTEQTLEENENKGFSTKYFDSENEAYEWLK